MPGRVGIFGPWPVDWELSGRTGPAKRADCVCVRGEFMNPIQVTSNMIIVAKLPGDKTDRNKPSEEHLTDRKSRRAHLGSRRPHGDSASVMSAVVKGKVNYSRCCKRLNVTVRVGVAEPNYVAGFSDVTTNAG